MAESYGVKISPKEKDAITGALGDLLFSSGRKSFRVVKKGTVFLELPYNGTITNTVKVELTDGTEIFNLGDENAFMVAFGDLGDSRPNAMLVKLNHIAGMLTDYIGQYVIPTWSDYMWGRAWNFIAIRVNGGGSTWPYARTITIKYFLVLLNG